MRFPWQSSPNANKTRKSTARPAKKLKKKFLPSLELLEKRELMNAAVINVNTPADTAGNTGLPQLMSSGGGTYTYCGSLREAINLVNQNGYSGGYTINLVSGGTYDITLPGDNDDLNAGGDFDIRGIYPVTIQTASGGSAATIYGPSGGGDRVFDIGPKSNVTFNDVDIADGSTTSDGGGIRSAPGSIVKLTNTDVESCTASDGGGIAAGFTGMNLSGGTLYFGSGGSGGTNSLSLGSLSPGSGGSLCISGGYVEDNEATGDGFAEGGGIASCGESLYIGNATISHNTAGFSGGSGEGGGVYVVDPGHHFTTGTNVSFINDNIMCNTAGSYASFSGGTVGGQGLGGGIFLSRLDSATISGGGINDNRAFGNATSGGAGAGIYLTSIHSYSGGGLGGTVCVSNTSIASNTADGSFSGGGGGQGGGAWIGTGETVNFTNGTTFAGNQAEAGNRETGIGGKGGGIYATGAIVSLTNTTIGSTSAGLNNNNVGHGESDGGSGGGIYFSGLGEKISGGSCSSLTITCSTIQYNVAEGGTFSGGATNGGEGGGIFLKAYGAYSGGTQVTITSSTIYGNTAWGGFSGGTGGEGGGMYIGCNLSVCISGGSISGNTAGGASAFDDGEAQGGKGGGIYADGAVLKLTNVTVGGVSAGNLAAQGFSGGSFDGGEGGGIYFIDLGKVLSGTGTAAVTSSLTISGGCVSYNMAQGGYEGDTVPAAGGGIFALAYGSYSGGTQISITNTAINDNQAAWNGAYGSGVPGGEGGGLYIGCNLSVCISGGSISGNTALAGSGGGGDYYAGQTGAKGGGIFANGAIIKLTNTCVNGNSANGAFSGGAGSGGGIYFEGLGKILSGSGATATRSSLTISGGSVSENVAGAGLHQGAVGGGIYAVSFGCYSGGTQVSITGTCISGNTAQGGFSGGFGGIGGGLFLGNGMSVAICNATISGNTAGGGTGFSGGEASWSSRNGGGSGGGIYAFGNILSLTNTSVTCNLAQAGFSGGYGGNGGGIYFAWLGETLSGGGSTAIHSTLTISGGCISYNLAQGGKVPAPNGFSGGGFAEGGGVFVSSFGCYSGGTQVTITCASIIGNTAQGGFSGGLGGAGGGLFIDKNLSVNITNSVIASNTAGGATGFSGGAEPSVTVTTGLVYGYGTAGGGSGGGIYMDGSILVLTNTTIGGPSCANGNVAQGGVTHAEGGKGFSGGFGGEGGGIYATDLGRVLSGGGATAIRSSLTVSGGCIDNNKAEGGDFVANSFYDYTLGAGDGGGIFAQAYCYTYFGGTQVSITNANIFGNTAQGGFSGGAGGGGGGLFLNRGVSATISCSTIAGNTATGATDSEADFGGAGGGIFSNGAILQLNGDTIGGPSCYDANVAGAGCFGGAGTGGGIFAGGLGEIVSAPSCTVVQSTLTISGGCITGNSALGGLSPEFQTGGGGGGIFASNGFSGGGIGLDVKTSQVVSGVKPATEAFGSYSGGVQLSITGTVISKNVAQGGSFSGGAGGGILIDGALSASICNATLSCNSATGAFCADGSGGVGGGIFSYDAILKLTNTNVGVSGGGNFAGGDCASGGNGGAGGGIFAVGLGNFITCAGTESTLTISGGSVSFNYAQGGRMYGADGGGILAGGNFSGGGNQVSITNVAIKNNTAAGATSGGCFSADGGSGGGIALFNVSALITSVAGGTATCISGNVAGSAGGGADGGGKGGGIFLDHGILQLTNATVSGNLAQGNIHNGSGGGGSGGGIYAENLGDCVEEYSATTVVPAHTSGGSGGTEFLTELIINGSTITCNGATNGCEGGGAGGGIAAIGGSGGGLGFSMIDSTVSYNYVGACSGTSSACEFGAGVYFDKIDAYVFADLIDYNKTDGSCNSEGGGVYVGYDSYVEIINTTIAFNTAGYGYGGGLATPCGTCVSLVNDTIAYNIAYTGGGVYRSGVSGGATSVLNTIIAENFSKATGGTETDVYGTFEDLGYNLIGTNLGATGSFTESPYVASVDGNNALHHTVNANHDFVGGTIHGALSTFEVGLAQSLAINQLAGFAVPFTLTLALEYGSLAIDGGLYDSTTILDLTAPGGVDPQDQRGPGYIRLSEFDIGAFQKTPTNTTNTVSRNGDDT